MNCKKDALKLLARKAYHSQELARKLRLKNHPAEEIAAAIQEMRRLGYLNDKEYMEAFLRKAALKGWDAYTIKGKLYLKGILSQEEFD